MEKNSTKNAFSEHRIPVISYNDDARAWTPALTADEYSRAVAQYKNQLDEIERIKASIINRSYEPQWEENAWRASASESRHNPKKSRLPRWFTYFFLIAAAFYLLWLYAQSR